MSDYPELFDDKPDDALLGGGWTSMPPAEPAHDERGEIIDAEIVDDDSDDVLDSEAQLLPGTLARNGARAVELFRDPDAVQTLTRDARSVLIDRVRALANRAREQRDDGKATSATLAPELQLMADAHDTLAAIRDVFTAGALEAREISGELARELADDLRKSSSVRVGDQHGTDVKVTRTVQTELRIDRDEIVDVLVAHIMSRMDLASVPHGARAITANIAAVAVRDALRQYARIASAHSFKSTELDAYVRELESADEHALAIRLGHAYGRVSNGKETVKLERVEARGSNA